MPLIAAVRHQGAILLAYIKGAHLLSRVLQNGQRRAEEMRESAKAVREAGFAPLMASASADREKWLADLVRAGFFGDLPKVVLWHEYADRLLAAREGK